MKSQVIKAHQRIDQGKGASRRLRRAGLVPAIIYGGEQPATNIQLDHEKVWLAQAHEWFYSSILHLDIDGSQQRVLLRDLQRHPYKRVIMHIDFQRVNENEKLTASVPLHFIHADQSPAGKTRGVVITHELNEVQVFCLPKYLPAYIEVDLHSLEVGQVIHLSDLALPQGVELPALKIDKEHNVAVVIARHASSDPVEDDTSSDTSAGSDSKTK